MKNYKVFFEAEETVWNKCVANVEANSKKEAYKKVSYIINSGDNPFRDLDCEWDGTNTVTNEVIETSKYIVGKGCTYSLDDVKEADSRPYCEVHLKVSSLIELDKNQIYKVAEEKFARVGLKLSIEDMEILPIKIEEKRISLQCIPVSYKRTWSNGEVTIV